MWRYIKSSISVISLSGNLFNITSRSLYISKEIIPRKISNNISHKKCGILFNQNSIMFSTISGTPEIEAPSDEPNIAEITGGDPDLEHKLKVLILEMEVSHQEGKAVPQKSTMKTENWKELLNLNSKSARKKYLEFLFKLEKKKENKLKKKELKRLAFEEVKSKRGDNENDGSLKYNLGGNHIFLRFYDSTINDLYNHRLIQAMQFGQKLVLDCGYHENMTKQENANCSKQLMLLFADNRMSDEPFDLRLCNVEHESTLITGLQKFIPTMYEPWFPLNFHKESYLDLFPKEQLVYLTPHCRDVMKEFDHNAIYIIGAIVDKVNNEPLSLAKAKKEGIRMAKLPLDYYLEWGAGSGKSLTINQILAVLLDIKRTGDWNYALRHVPRRKLADTKLTYAVNKFKSRLSYTSRINPESDIKLDKLTYNRNRKNNVSDKKSDGSRLSDLRKIIRE